MTYDLYDRRVFVAGHRGMVGRALLRRLESERCEVITLDKETVDLRDHAATGAFLKAKRPNVVLMAAGRVGGIGANIASPLDYLLENVQMATSVINGAREAGVKRLVYFGSSCAYPRAAAQPIKESELLAAGLEPTNEGYALAKIVGVRLCDAIRAQMGLDYFSLMPCNLYGPFDSYGPDRSHVAAAMILRMHTAKIRHLDVVTCWGTGRPMREFLSVDDLADATVFALKHWSGQGVINVGTGTDISIEELAHLVAKVVGYPGAIGWDHSKPDGVPRKLLDITTLSDMGWSAPTSLEDGLFHAYRDFIKRDEGMWYPLVDFAQGQQ